MLHSDELPPQSRAAHVTYLLLLRNQLTTREIMEATGITTSAGVGYLMANLSLGGIPVYKAGTGRWALLPNRRS